MYLVPERDISRPRKGYISSQKEMHLVPERVVSRPRKIPSYCGVHPGSYSVVKRVLSPAAKGQIREIDYSSSYSVEVQDEWCCTSTSHISLYGMYMRNFGISDFWIG